jgi:hypothetical protein
MGNFIFSLCSLLSVHTVYSVCLGIVISLILNNIYGLLPLRNWRILVTEAVNLLKLEFRNK